MSGSIGSSSQATNWDAQVNALFAQLMSSTEGSAQSPVSGGPKSTTAPLPKPAQSNAVSLQSPMFQQAASPASRSPVNSDPFASDPELNLLALAYLENEGLRFNSDSDNADYTDNDFAFGGGAPFNLPTTPSLPSPSFSTILPSAPLAYGGKLGSSLNQFETSLNQATQGIGSKQSVFNSWFQQSIDPSQVPRGVVINPATAPQPTSSSLINDLYNQLRGFTPAQTAQPPAYPPALPPVNAMVNGLSQYAAQNAPQLPPNFDANSFLSMAFPTSPFANQTAYGAQGNEYSALGILGALGASGSDQNFAGLNQFVGAAPNPMTQYGQYPSAASYGQYTQYGQYAQANNSFNATQYFGTSPSAFSGYPGYMV